MFKWTKTFSLISILSCIICFTSASPLKTNEQVQVAYLKNNQSKNTTFSEIKDVCSGLTIRSTSIETDLLNLQKPLKIVLFSDLHISDWLKVSELEKIIQTINSLSPDLIVFTGDLIDANISFTENKEDVVNVLKKLSSKYGKVAILGNHDVVPRMKNISEEILTAAGFNLLKNDIYSFNLQSDINTTKTKEYSSASNTSVNIYGLIDIDSKSYSTKILDKLNPKEFNIILNHRPDLIDEYIKLPFSLQLSGHSHAGQVVGKDGVPLGTTPYGNKYIDGLFKFDNKYLLVNRGIGYSRLKIRINAPSTIDLIYLKKQ